MAMAYITSAQISTAQTAIAAAQGAGISLDIYQLPYNAQGDPLAAGTGSEYTLDAPQKLATVDYVVGAAYASDLAYISNANYGTSGHVYLVAGTSLATK